MYVPQKLEENITKALDYIMEDNNQGKIFITFIYSCMDLLPCSWPFYLLFLLRTRPAVLPGI